MLLHSNLKIIFCNFSRTEEDYTISLEEILMLSDERRPRYPFIAEGVDGSQEYPPEIIKATKTDPMLFYCENPRYPLYFNRQTVLNAVSPGRREKMEDICDAKQIR